MNRNLVIARAGRRSLHASWIGGRRPRNWDLHLAPYEPTHADSGCACADVIPGPKWSGLRALLNGWDGWRDSSSP